MFVKKWIVTEYLENINELTDIIVNSDVQICWCPRYENDFYDLRNFNLVQKWQHSKIAIGFRKFSQIQNPELFSTNIIRFFFQTTYFKEQNNPCIFHFLSEEENDNKVLLESLNKTCLQQGFARLITYQYKNQVDQKPSVFYSEPNIVGITNYKTFLDHWIDKIIDTQTIKEAFVFIPFEETTITKKAILDLQSEETRLINSKIYHIADLLAQKYKVMNDDKIFLEALKEDISNKSLYLEMQKNNSVEIMKWYHNEYEILPLWYKRFGHIIKVITGKRKFRSLFSDQVKKYND